jgi:hypothetical protein
MSVGLGVIVGNNASIRSFSSIGTVEIVLPMPEGVISMLFPARIERIEQETARWE